MEVCIYADEGGGLLNNWGSIRADSREEENLLLIYFFFPLFSFTKYLQREIDKIFRSINRDAFFKFLNYVAHYYSWLLEGKSGFSVFLLEVVYEKSMRRERKKRRKMLGARSARRWPESNSRFISVPPISSCFHPLLDNPGTSLVARSLFLVRNIQISRSGQK